MDTVHRVGSPTKVDPGEKFLSRKEIRRRKLMEYLAAKANVTLPGKKPNMDKDESEKGNGIGSKVVMDKENKIPSSNRDVKDKTFQSTYLVKRPLGLKNTVNINCTKPYEKKDGKTVLENKKGTKAYQTPRTIVNPRPLLNAANKKPLYSKAQFTNTHVMTHATAENNTKTICTNSASSIARMTIDGRMIHGPIVKTRTGLMPAVIQPRNLKSHILTTNDSKTSTNEAQTNTKAQRPKSQASNRFSRATASKPAHLGTVAIAEGGRKEPENKCSTASLTNHVNQTLKKLPDKPHLAAACTSKFEKPYSAAKTTKTSGFSSNFYSHADKNNNNKANIRRTTNAITSTRDHVKVSKRVSACNNGSKNTDSKEVQKKNTNESITAPVPSRQKKMPSVSKTAPRPPRSLTITYKPKDMQTPHGRAPPQTVRKTLTAADERIKKLQEWREAKGISYKRPPMFVKTRARRTAAVPQPFWSNLEQEEDAQSIICAVERSLQDCIKLLEKGCPTHQVKEVLSRLPVVSQKFVKYWICQARLMEREGNLEVLPLFEEAVGLVLEPVDELRTVIFDILKKRDENQGDDEIAKETPEAISPETLNDPMITPRPTRALICAEKGSSSVVKYKITATPGGPPSQRRESFVVNGQEVRFFTPVRRSVRIERASLRYPTSLQDRDLCVASYDDLIAEEEKETVEQSECASSVTNTPLYIYRENDALRDKVTVDCVYNDE